MTQDTLVLGGGQTGLELATGRTGRGQAVGPVDDGATVDRTRAGGTAAHGSTPEAAASVVGRSAATVAATACDGRAPPLARGFDADRVVAPGDGPADPTTFEDAGVETVRVPTALAAATTEAVGLGDRPTTEVPTEPTGTVTVRA